MAFIYFVVCIIIKLIKKKKLIKSFFQIVRGAHLKITQRCSSYFFKFEIWPNPVILVRQNLKLLFLVLQNFSYFLGSDKFLAIFLDPLNEEHTILKNIRSLWLFVFAQTLASSISFFNGTAFITAQPRPHKMQVWIIIFIHILITCNG